MTDKTTDSRFFLPTAQDLKMVAAMAEGGLSLEAIRHAVINPRTGRPVSRATLRQHFERVIEGGRAKARHLKYRPLQEDRYKTGKKTPRRRRGRAVTRDGWPALRDGERVAGESEQARVVVYIPDNGSGPPTDDAGAEGTDESE